MPTNTLTNLADSIEKAVREYCDDVGKDDATTKGRGLTQWCLLTLFDLQPEQAIDAMKVSGTGDNSLDAFFDDGDGLVVLQCKYNSHSWAELAKFDKDLKRLLQQDLPAGRQDVREAAAQLRDAYAKGDGVRAFYITNKNFTGDDVHKLGSLEVVHAMELSDIDEWIRDRGRFTPASQKGKRLSLRSLVGTAGALRFDGSVLFPVALLDLAEFVDAGKDFLFSSNVRNYLSRSKINGKIRETVRAYPDRFWEYNNGITIVCDEWQEVGQETFELQTPQVVNGCQTAQAVRNELAILDDSQKKVVQGAVLVRVYKEASEEQRRDISRNTNRQNAVKAKDFFALEDFQRGLAQQFKKLGYYYEIQTGSWDQLEPSQRDGYKGDSRFNHLEWRKRDYCVQAIEAVKCYSAAFRNKVAVCYSNPADLAPGGSQYDQVFTDDLPEEPELFLIPFLVLKDCEARFGYRARSEDFHGRGRYLFTNTAFRSLLRALLVADLVPYERDQLQPGDVRLIREFFSRDALSKPLLEMTEQAMKSFFGDSFIKEQVGQDIFQFLKGPVEKEKATRILEDKIGDLLREPIYKQMVVEMRETLTS